MNKQKKNTIAVWAVASLIFVVVVILFILAKNEGSLKVLNNLLGFKSETQKTSEIPSNNKTSENKTNQELNLPSNLPENLNVNKLTAKDGSQNEATLIAFVEKERLVVVIEAKLPEPAGGQHYAAWLSQNSNREYFFLGKLEKIKDNFGISANFQGDFSTYKTVVVTQETNDDKLPEKIILEGALSK